MQRNNDALLKKLIEEHELNCFTKSKKFIVDNPLALSIDDLSRLAEMANGLQESTAAYYTDPKTVQTLCQQLPKIHKRTLKILEPSVGVGNILRQVIHYYKGLFDSIECDVFDINQHSLEICEIFIQKEFSDFNNLKINYIYDDFLTHQLEKKYDLVVGNPPFMKIKGAYRENLRQEFNNSVADNISAFFLDKSILLSNYVVLIMPKYFLHNFDFSKSREKIKNTNIQCITDFGETGFKGVLIETICLFLDTKSENISGTKVISVPKKIELIQDQNEITQSFFPNWLIYINENFKKLVSEMSFGIFNVFRDRQITSKLLEPTGDIWVIKSKNIPRSGDKIIHIEDDVFIKKSALSKLGVNKYLERDDVFLSPNMTYYPRVVVKPKNCVVNGSVAIFELKPDMSITEADLLFFASPEFEEFYRIARNHSTRSLNIDNIAIFYFGKRNHCVQ